MNESAILRRPCNFISSSVISYPKICQTPLALALDAVRPKAQVRIFNARLPPRLDYGIVEINFKIASATGQLKPVYTALFPLISKRWAWQFQKGQFLFDRRSSKNGISMGKSSKPFNDDPMTLFESQCALVLPHAM
jgi:hypothetical protein